MNFIVEYFTSTGAKQMEMQARTYREAEQKANSEIRLDNGLLGIKCIREIRIAANKIVHFDV